MIMKQTIYDEKTGLWYELQGEYYFPCVTVPEGTDNIEINSFDAESLFIGRRILTEGETGYTASYDIGGQFPGVRTMRLVWPEAAEQ